MKKIVKYMAVCVIILAINGILSAKGLEVSGLKVEWTTNYDDNILRYSDRDIDNFTNSTEAYPSRLSTYDDWNNELRLKFYADIPVMGKNPIKFKYLGKVSSFYRNPFNNYTNHTFLVNFDITEKIGIGLRYFYMPDYYLRDYKDKDTNAYHSCRFDDNQAGVSFDYKFNKNTQAGISGQYEEIYYNGYFTEYDCELLSFAGEINQRISNNLRCSFSAGMSFADNVGYVPASVAPPYLDFTVDTEYGDGSYNEEIYQGEIRYRFKKLLGQDTWAGLQYKLRHRIYTTDNSLTSDPFHAGRMDNRHRLMLTIDRKITGKLSGFITFTHEWRNSESDNPSVELVKDFKQNVMALGLEYSIK